MAFCINKKLTVPGAVMIFLVKTTVTIVVAFQTREKEYSPGPYIPSIYIKFFRLPPNGKTGNMIFTIIQRMENCIEIVCSCLLQNIRELYDLKSRRLYYCIPNIVRKLCFYWKCIITTKIINKSYLVL